MDVFRKEYRELNPDEIEALKQIKESAERLYGKLDRLTFSRLVPPPEGASIAAESFQIKADPRAMALAKTKLEESVMWAVKAITG